jgi:hypothetical protein
MVWRPLTDRSLVAFAFASAMFMAATPSRAEMSPGFGRTAASVPWAGQGCGWGAYRAPNGSCDIVKDPNANYQAGFYSVPAPSGRGSGDRCVQNGY